MVGGPTRHYVPLGQAGLSQGKCQGRGWGLHRLVPSSPLTSGLLLCLFHFQLGQQADEPLKVLLVAVYPDKVNLE